VSDIRKAGAVMGWRPLIEKEDGIRRLWNWVAANRDLFRSVAGQPNVPLHEAEAAAAAR
jgi:hypothetical protein